MNNKQGSVFGGTLLITGSCIGAGMLGLPILTGLPGFFPSFFMLLVAWLFMLISGLLMVEILGWFDRPVNLLSMIEHTLGPIGKVLCWFLYLFLFYALLIAYMSASGNHTSLFFQSVFQIPLPDWAGTLFFVLLFGWIVYLGTQPVDRFNRYLMYGKILSFILLVLLGIKHIVPHFLTYWKPKYALFTLPILIISFGFQNMIPVLMKYMGGDRKRVRKSIYIGSLVTLIIYLIWEIVAIGVLPYDTILHSYKSGIDAAQALRIYLGSHLIGYFAESLAFFSILTSFLAQTIGLTHFLTDGFKLQQQQRESISMCLLALLPPLAFALIRPDYFFQALNFAGGICAVVLFGIFPALMTWIGRYKMKNLLSDRVPGGRSLLLAMLLLTSVIFLEQFTTMFNMHLFPKF